MNHVIEHPPVAQNQLAPLRDEERQRCEIWTRVMGYHRPMASFNTGKKGEAMERVYFSETRCTTDPSA